jgi:hypothetical protein
MAYITSMIRKCLIQQFSASKKRIFSIDNHTNIPIFNISLTILIMRCMLSSYFGCDFVDHPTHRLQ